MSLQKFKLFACCIAVKGAMRSTICDLQRQEIFFIPNDLYEILSECKNLSLIEIYEIYDPENKDIIKEYFDFLIQNELGFWCKDNSHFPEIDLTWERPETITNAIIDIDSTSKHNYAAIANQLEQLGCKALQIRSFDFIRLSFIKEILDDFRYGRLRFIELIVKYDESIFIQELEELCKNYQGLLRIFVHSAPFEKIVEVPKLNSIIHFKKQIIDSSNHCGQINKEYFSVNLEVFMESQNFNTCLNKKISICTNGEIKNCPSLAKSFGNIRNTSLTTAVSHKDFKELWLINKDQVDICKDCEFRHVCTDCRAFTKKTSSKYAKPAKCNYNPYIAQWV